MGFKVCSSCGKQVQQIDSHCWNCQSTTFRAELPDGTPTAIREMVPTVSAAAKKKCPFCAEEIQAAAVKCRHCGSMLTGATPTRKTLPFVPVSGATPTSGGLFFLMAVALFILSVFLGSASTIIMVLGTSIWVALDASKHKLAEYQNGLGGPVGACPGSVLLWIVVFPWYLAVRSRIRAGVQPVKA